MARIYTITQEKLDAVKPEDRRVIFPGVTGPGEYTYSEADNLYRAVAAHTTEQNERNERNEYHGGMGIGGIGIYAENEAPIIPSAAALERYNRAGGRARVCRICGGSELNGAMFTTMASSGICDDCF